MAETLHSYTFFYKHRYLIWGIAWAMLLPVLTLWDAVENPTVLYQFSVGIFFAHLVLDIFIAKKSAPISLTEERLRCGEEVIPFEEMRYIHAEADPNKLDLLDTKQVKIAYGAGRELTISSRISGYQKILKALEKHGVPNNT